MNVEDIAANVIANVQGGEMKYQVTIPAEELNQAGLVIGPVEVKQEQEIKDVQEVHDVHDLNVNEVHEHEHVNDVKVVPGK